MNLKSKIICGFSKSSERAKCLTASPTVGARDGFVFSLLSQLRLEVAVHLPLLHKGPVVTLNTVPAGFGAGCVVNRLNALATFVLWEATAQEVCFREQAL